MQLLRLIYRELLIQWSLRPLAWTQLLYPIMYIFVAGFAYGALIRTVSIDGREFPYVQFLIPGIVASQVMLAAAFAGQTFGADRRTQMFSQILVLPFSRSEYLVSKICGIIIRGWLTGIVVSIIAGPILIQMPITVRGIALTLFGISLAAVLFGSLMFLVSVFVSGQEGLNVAFSIIAIPVLFLSSVFYPLDHAPAVVRSIGLLNPLSTFASILRSGLLDLPLDVSASTFASSVLASAIVFALAVLAFRRIEP